MIHRTCRLCQSDLPAPFLHLGDQPLANNLLSDPSEPSPLFPLALTKCRACHLVQLTEVVPPDLLFANYLYTPSQSLTFQRHFEEMASTLVDALPLHSGDLVVDIGSNDGLLLSHFQSAGMKVVGVEPARNLALSARDAGIPTINQFFSDATVHLILQDYGHPRLITATNVFAHIDNTLTVVAAIARLLDEEGVVVVETPSLATTLRQGYWDSIYHEHRSTWSLHTLRSAFIRANLHPYDVEEVSTHGGSLRVYFDKQIRRPTPRFRKAFEEEFIGEGEYQGLRDKAVLTRHQLKSYLLTRRGSVIAGYTSPAKATVLVNWCGLTGEDIAYVVDDNPLKQGKWLPTAGAPIPIVGFDWFTTAPPDVVILFSWNLRDELEEKLGNHGISSELVVPLPKFEVRAASAKRKKSTAAATKPL